jgi:acetyl-CoA carboxylase biotin carboxyl carrier protein
MPADGNEQREVPSGRGKGSSRSAKAGQPAQSNGAATSPAVMIDLDFVRGLIDAVDGSSIDTLEINRGGTRIRISKTPTPAAVVTGPGGAAAQAPGPAPAASTVAMLPPTAAAAAEPESTRGNLVDVTSPMVGTFYRAPAPEAPPYVEVGSHVTKGQTLCILEAMKLMNELECEVDGVVREILVSNADPVEYGQPLFRIDPAGAAA